VCCSVLQCVAVGGVLKSFLCVNTSLFNRSRVCFHWSLLYLNRFLFFVEIGLFCVSIGLFDSAVGGVFRSILFVKRSLLCVDWSF